MLNKICLLIVFVVAILYNSINIKHSEIDIPLFKIEIRGEVENEITLEVEQGTTVKEVLNMCQLKEKADISGISLNEAVYNNEVIVIPKITEKSRISINSAGIEELITLPGVGIKVAEKIIEYRKENGSFNRLEDIMNVSGIGKTKYEKLKEYIVL